MKQHFAKEEEGVGGGTRPESVFLSLLGDVEGSGENEETREMSGNKGGGITWNRSDQAPR